MLVFAFDIKKKQTTQPLVLYSGFIFIKYNLVLKMLLNIMNSQYRRRLDSIEQIIEKERGQHIFSSAL